MSRLLPISLALLPLLIAPGLSLNYDVIPRLAVFEILLCAALAYTAGWVPGLRTAWSSGYGRLFMLLLAASVFCIAASTLTSADRNISTYGSTWRELGLITWTSVLVFAAIALGTLIRTPALTRSMLRAVSVSGIVGACYGILQYFGIDPILHAAGYHAGEGVFTIVRTPGTLGHADYFASWLVVVFFLALPLSSRESGAWRVVGYAAQVTSAVAIVLSGTRAAIVALLVGAAVALAVERPRIRLRHIAAFATPVLLGVLFYISPLGAQLRARVHWSLEDARGGARLLLWRDSLRMVVAHPFVGFGPETYSFVFPRFQSADLSRQYPDWYHESPHNVFLDAAASEGFPGLLLTLALFAIGGLSAWAARRKQPILSAALLAVLAAQFVNFQFVALTLTAAVFLLLSVVISVAAAIPPDTAVQALPRWTWVPACIACLIFMTYAVRLSATDVQLARFDRAVTQARIAPALTEYDAARRWSPSGRAADLYCSRRLFAAGGSTGDLLEKLRVSHAAFAAGAQAVTTADDRQNAWYNLAILTAAEGDRAGVEHCLRQATAASPNWFRPHWALARLLQAEGRTNEARVEAAAALRLNGGHDPQLASSLSGSALQTVSAR